MSSFMKIERDAPCHSRSRATRDSSTHVKGCRDYLALAMMLVLAIHLLLPLVNGHCAFGQVGDSLSESSHHHEQEQKPGQWEALPKVLPIQSSTIT